MPRQTMNAMRELKSLGGESIFPRLHHFASDKFASAPSTFQQHWDYCEKVQEFRDGNNDQTCRRIQAAVQAKKAGSTWERAIERAWQRFPALLQV
jgi:hypothetical protein